MRSKEVEEAINDSMFIVITDIYDNEIRIDKTKIINEYNGSVGTVLDYIKKLEKLPNKIRNKIEELEKEVDDLVQNGDVQNNNLDKYNYLMSKVDILKELLGE